MKDSAVPSLVAQNEGVFISLTIPQSQAQLDNQGYTYNQASFSYNQTGVAYGGIYNTNEDIAPILTTAFSNYPSLTVSFNGGNISLSIPQTQALLANQGYTYNQAGFSYNQLSAQYAGIYNTNEDVLPLELGFVDIYSKKIVPPPTGGNVGPGWFMYINLT